MLSYLKRIRAEDWPAVILRGTALVLIVSHLITFFFIYKHLLFLSTALVMGLLLAREMYEDLAQRFFKMKAEEYEKDLAKTHKPDETGNERPLLIEGIPSMKDITKRISGN